MKQFVYYIECLHSLDNTRLLVTYRLMHTLFHIRTVIIPRNRYRLEGFSPRGDISRGMITVLIWKRVCINLFITYFNIELKRTKLTSHTHRHARTHARTLHIPEVQFDPEYPVWQVHVYPDWVLLHVPCPLQGPGLQSKEYIVMLIYTCSFVN